MDETHSRGDEIMEIPKLAPFSSQSNLLNKCWPDTGLGCLVSQVKVRNLLIYQINEFVIWKLMITNKKEMKLEVGITIPKLTVSKKRKKKKKKSILIFNLLQFKDREKQADY